MGGCNSNVRKTFMRTKFEERCGFAAEAEAEEEQEERQGNNLGSEDGGTATTQVAQENAVQLQERNGVRDRDTNDDNEGGRERLLYVSVLDAVLAAIDNSGRFHKGTQTVQHIEPSKQPPPGVQNEALTIISVSQSSALSQNENSL